MDGIDQIRSYLGRFQGVTTARATTTAATAANRGGLSDTMSFSFCSNTGIPGISYGNGNDIANFIHRPGLDITYFGIVFAGDPETTYSIRLQDGEGNVVQRLTLKAAEGIQTKVLSESFLAEGVRTDASRLMRILLESSRPDKRLLVYTIMVGFN